MTFDASTVAGMIHQVGSSVATTFSDSFTWGATTMESVAAFAETQSPADRSRLLRKVHGFCFVDDTTKLRKVSCLKWVKDKASEKVILVGSLGDSLSQEALPVSISSDALDPKHFVSLASEAMVSHMSLPHIPTSEHDPTQEPDPAAMNDSNRSIHWDYVDDNPVFSAFMTIFPLLEGIDLPLDGHDLSEPLPPSWDDDAPEEFVAWVEGVKYLIDHNNGRSLHCEHTMFPASSVPVDKFGGALSLVSSPTITFTTLDITSRHYRTVLGKFQADREAAWLRVSRSAVIDWDGQVTNPKEWEGYVTYEQKVKTLSQEDKLKVAMLSQDMKAHMSQRDDRVFDHCAVNLVLAQRDMMAEGVETAASPYTVEMEARAKNRTSRGP
eukprot:scaffold14920_cov63-Cylindrotheca_fusiformis.AAC.6